MISTTAPSWQTRCSSSDPDIYHVIQMFNYVEVPTSRKVVVR